MEAQLHQGLVGISDYKGLLQTELFSRMEKFSNNFVTQNSEALSAYSRKWIMDPLHQWSRQWEYPFVFSQIQKYAATRQDKPIKILDAGSGVTFFPYFLEETVKDSMVTCCDMDTELPALFESINSNMDKNISVLNSDIKNTGIESNSCDIVYCVSVLEHTSDYDKIVEEFIRILKNNIWI